MKNRAFIYIAWIQSIVAVVTSLYYSEVAGLTPCLLCWYQRIVMYPLVIIMAVGLWRRDQHLPYYVLPFGIIGAITALYHYLLQVGVISESLAPCVAGVSCATKEVQYFGFVTIPFLSLLAFVLISVCMIIIIRKGDKNE